MKSNAVRRIEQMWQTFLATQRLSDEEEKVVAVVSERLADLDREPMYRLNPERAGESIKQVIH